MSQTHIGIEIRLTMPEARAVDNFIIKCRALVRKKLAWTSITTDELDELESGLEKLLDQIRQSNEPFA